MIDAPAADSYVVVVLVDHTVPEGKGGLEGLEGGVGDDDNHDVLSVETSEGAVEGNSARDTEDRN